MFCHSNSVTCQCNTQLHCVPQLEPSDLELGQTEEAVELSQKASQGQAGKHRQTDRIKPVWHYWEAVEITRCGLVGGFTVTGEYERS